MAFNPINHRILYMLRESSWVLDLSYSMAIYGYLPGGMVLSGDMEEIHTESPLVFHKAQCWFLFCFPSVRSYPLYPHSQSGHIFCTILGHPYQQQVVFRWWDLQPTGGHQEESGRSGVQLVIEGVAAHKRPDVFITSLLQLHTSLMNSLWSLLCHCILMSWKKAFPKHINSYKSNGTW